jgi:ElaB/YqjD/DUF883 family membrane-anchored ribosome-binding protein
MSEESVGDIAKKTRKRAEELAEAGKESLAELTATTKERLDEVVKNANEQIKKVEDMARESPGTALAVTFMAGLAVGGVIALLALSKKD